ncbi:MAG: hypothetical protein EWV41_17575 [Microcystis wesenbergii Mw_MB_S_20031200_S109]|uniref:Uncharacterized protein n=1 Tax=Microcystis wesenbergii Mw_MB_S_20031200_S109D TaxID=2486241 RepID=A0A552M2L1_9CHRO|nr:MAG: hypothetical protein EWV41_17575 [Microcystis wesenbergii Mw_MB_S_20031200_S109]TRV26704.1 MAG: hypothetical protein EWV88_05875 [Microcystis wesenbergii Mw_MB_S_20031200_S109D]
MKSKVNGEVRSQESGDRRQGTGDRRLFLFILPTSPFPHFPAPHTLHPLSSQETGISLGIGCEGIGK